MVLCCWKGGKDLFPALPPSSQGFKKAPPPATPTNLGVMPCWSVKGSWLATWMELRKNQWPQMYFLSGLRHSHCVIGGLTLTLIHVIQRKSPYERRGAGETAKCLSGNGIPQSKKILRWKQKHKPRRLATTIFRAPPGWPPGDSPEAPVWEGLSSSTPAPRAPALSLASGPGPCPHRQGFRVKLCPANIGRPPAQNTLLPSPTLSQGHTPSLWAWVPWALSSASFLLFILWPQPQRPELSLLPCSLIPAAFPLGQMSITNGLESEESGISRTPIRSL